MDYHTVEKWCVKLRRYDGSESVVRLVGSEPVAQAYADGMNFAYQSDSYYVEPYDPDLAADWLR